MLFLHILGHVKAEMQGKEEVKSKLEESQKREKIMDVALKVADAENKKLTMRESGESKEEL